VNGHAPRTMGAATTAYVLTTVGVTTTATGTALVTTQRGGVFAPMITGDPTARRLRFRAPGAEITARALGCCCLTSVSARTAIQVLIVKLTHAVDVVLMGHVLRVPPRAHAPTITLDPAVRCLLMWTVLAT
jgi:hypothetical protein